MNITALDLFNTFYQMVLTNKITVTEYYRIRLFFLCFTVRLYQRVLTNEMVNVTS